MRKKLSKESEELLQKGFNDVESGRVRDFDMNRINETFDGWEIQKNFFGGYTWVKADEASDMYPREQELYAAYLQEKYRADELSDRLTNCIRKSQEAMKS